jgi:uncharacterized protein (TIGR03437 family)
VPKVLAAFLLCAAAQAASLNVMVSVTATVTVGASITASGTATLTGGISDTGQFSATIPLSAITGTTVTAPYTMKLSNGTMAGNAILPVAVLEGTTPSAAGMLTVTSGTGSYSGDTGSFNVSGSGGLNSSGAIMISFSGSGTISTGGSTPPSGPTITAVLDAGSYTANVAQGGLFVVKGSGLSASGSDVATPPWPNSIGGTSITFTPTAGGTGTQAYLLYTYSQNGVNQLAGLVPSTLVAGNYTVTVTYNGSTSAAFATQVVAAKPALLTQDTTGTGLASVQNFISGNQYDLNRLTTGTLAGGTTISPAKPGQVVVAWGTGLGAVPFPDNSPPSSGYSYPNVTVLVGGTAITPAYAGVSGYPGLDQINFTLPANGATGCAVSLQIMVGSVTSIATTISIAPTPSATACVSPGLTTQQLEQLDQGGTYTAGDFELLQLTGNVAGTGNQSEVLATGGFTQVTGFELGALSASTSVLTSSIGGCTVISVTSTGSSPATAVGTVTSLDAGKVTLNGPSGSNITNQVLTETNNTYFSLLGVTGLPGASATIVSGTYTLNGAGGKDVGSFQTSIAASSPLTITGGLPASVTESAGLTLNWTGGNASDVVIIAGTSSTISGTGANQVTSGTEFYCTTTAGKGTYTVPASVLTQLPKVAANAIQTGTGEGTLEVFSGQSPVAFAPSLTAGGTIPSSFGIFVGTYATESYQ